VFAVSFAVTPSVCKVRDSPVPKGGAFPKTSSYGVARATRLSSV
jgi:hypothetical protein